MAEYREYMRRSIDFIRARNARIDGYAIARAAKTGVSMNIVGLQKRQWFHPQLCGDAFHRAQGEVALSALQPAHIRTVHAHDVGERFLAEPAGEAIAAQVRTEQPLQVAFHDALDAARTLLIDLQTYE